MITFLIVCVVLAIFLGSVAKMLETDKKMKHQKAVEKELHDIKEKLDQNKTGQPGG